MSKLENRYQTFDVFGLIDVSRGDLPTRFSNVIRFSEASCIALGLNRGQPHLFHQYGDIAMSYAIRECEGYEHYAMFDDDVDFARDGAAFCNQLAETLHSRHQDIDFLGLDYKYCPAEQGYGIALRKLLPQRLMYYAYYPFVLLSARAANFIFAMRQLEFAKGLSMEKRVMCEGFVPSMLKAAGFKCFDLNEIIPGCYSKENMILQYSGHGLPMSAKMELPDSEQMLHAVYSEEEFLRKLVAKFVVNGRPDWAQIRNVLIGPSGKSISTTKLNEFFSKNTVDILNLR